MTIHARLQQPLRRSILQFFVPVTTYLVRRLKVISVHSKLLVIRILCIKPKPTKTNSKRIGKGLAFSPKKKVTSPQQNQLMKKLKYLAPILIAVACLGLEHAKADTVDYTLTTANDSGLGTGPFGTAHVDRTSFTTATITFTAAPGYLFVDGGSVAVNVNANTWTIGNFFSNGNPVSDAGAGNEDGFGSFNQKVSMQNSSNGASIISFVLTNTSGVWLTAANVLAFNVQNWLVAAHIQIATGLTGFAAGPNGGSSVPDGGTTVMLLGAALGALGIARRYLFS